MNIEHNDPDYWKRVAEEQRKHEMAMMLRRPTEHVLVTLGLKKDRKKGK